MSTSLKDSIFREITFKLQGCSFSTLSWKYLVKLWKILQLEVISNVSSSRNRNISSKSVNSKSYRENESILPQKAIMSLWSAGVAGTKNIHLKWQTSKIIPRFPANAFEISYSFWPKEWMIIQFLILSILSGTIQILCNQGGMGNNPNNFAITYNLFALLLRFGLIPVWREIGMGFFLYEWRSHEYRKRKFLMNHEWHIPIFPMKGSAGVVKQ